MASSIQPYLEYQADRVEAVLAAHRAPSRVTGGTVGPRLIRFFLDPAPHIRFASIKRLADDLALAMRVATLNVNRGREGVVLEFSHPEPHSVKLMAMLNDVRPVPVSTAVLGLTDDGLPLLARLAAPEVSHLLVAGTTGSGKSVLMRTIAASLALTHETTVLQMLCIDPKGQTFEPFAGLPHLIRPPVVENREALEALRSAVRVMEIRDRRGEVPVSQPAEAQGRSAPRLVVFIDELADLIMTGESAIQETITRLVQRGRQAGIHLVAATQHPSSAILGSLIRANFPLRLVGRVVSAADARVASGRGGTEAHLLNGRGDFLAVNGGDRPIRFQVAYIGKKEIQQQVNLLRAEAHVPQKTRALSLPSPAAPSRPSL